MKQVTQTLKNGEVQLLDVPLPLLNERMIRVKNFYSIISPGTEGATVSTARKSLIGKAKERPQQFKQVVEFLKQKGPVQTYRTVKQRLDAYSPLGYSCAGEVIEVAKGVKEFKEGDLVACGGGGYAHHAEFVAVPHNLCVKLPPDADLKKAAYNTLGAIALQSVRQADLHIGETCVVIGLGLVGQLASLILRAGGIRVVGLDIATEIVKIAREHCADVAWTRNEPGLVRKIDDFSVGIGADAVIITASSKSLDPVNFAGQVARKKGRIVVVGDVPTGFGREAYYRKELELRMSCSYGPGRYDPNYEEKGMDYPVGYVRWTEKRNMEAFQEFIHSGRIDIDYLTTHVFELEEATKAYDLILKKREPYLGILIRYGRDKTDQRRKIILREKSPAGKVNIGLIGVGNYASNFILPNIPKDKDVVLKGVMDALGIKSRTAADRYGFEFCTSDENDVFNHKEINTVFIATQHNTHAEYVLKALKAGKNVWVEKPLCLRESELKKIKQAYDSFSDSQPILTVGFNRRFSPLTEMLKKHLTSGPAAMIYRINAGYIPSDSWIQDREIGGGRIIGEVCHFVDYLTYVCGSRPDSVFATALPDSENMEDTVTISIRFKNGSIGTISYFSNGSEALFKEYIEVFQSGITGIIKDFKELRIYGNGKTFKKKWLSQDKGQKHAIKAFVETIRKGEPSPLVLEDIYSVTSTTFNILESIRMQKAISIG